ncbi:hypothetical protein [Crocosphaera chwakensis]|uniref:Uncharacterized protein n=1 Tax=Crocosphaera chwakensis CCY0110 TaxID=391612 RepID=A3ISR3_9CHRO|nr:hypothetical protein [Crocosphaera chwakensis]EAZ90483.1 hypothetical protein CY0110_26687 [Crocosphaera chwakensis CCY0110]
MNNKNHKEIRNDIELTNPEQMYQIKDSQGNIVDIEEANGRQLFNHYRHNMTNYDKILDDVRKQQGYVSGRQEKQAAIGAAEKVLELQRNEHIKVVKDAQIKGNFIKQLFQKFGVATASALTQKLDELSENIKQISHLENSQRSLQTWNDTYRVQKELVKELLKQKNVSEDVIIEVDKIYGTRSVNKAVEMGCQLFNWEASQTIKLIKSAVRYSKLKLEE